MTATLAGASLAVGLGLVVFVATSFDNLLILLGFSADPAYPPRVVRPAYVGSVLLVALVAAGLAAVARLAPDRHVGLLGWIPLGMGLYQLARLAVRRESVAGAARAADEALRKTLRLRRGRAAVAGVTLAASGDSLAAYAALFADTATRFVPWSLLGIGLGATGWSVLAVRLSGRPAVRSAVDRIGPILLPLVLVGIGLYILGDTPTDVPSTP